MVLITEGKDSLHERALDIKQEFFPKLVSVVESGFTLFDAYGIGIGLRNADALFNCGEMKVIREGSFFKFLNTRTQSYVKLDTKDFMPGIAVINEADLTLNMRDKNGFNSFFRFRSREAMMIFLEG